MREPSQLNSVMVGRVYRVWRVSHLLGGPGTPPMSFAVENRLHMDRTTSRVLHSRFADCYRQLERIPEIGTRISPTRHLC